MKLYIESEFFADIADVVRQYFPNEKLEKSETDENCRLSFFAVKSKDKEKYTCVFDDFEYTNEIALFDNWTNIEKKRFTKRYTKLCVYKCLATVLNKKLAWGALTGIRPTKLAYELKHDGYDVKEEFANTFFVSDNKTALVEDILKEQEGLINVDDNYADLYINIPFCVSKCSYCSFVSGDINKQKQFVAPYVETLCKEIEETQKIVRQGNYNLNHLYIGGGTPTSLSRKDLEKILSSVKFKPNEFTVEAGRPDTIDEDKLKLFKDFGVNRISVNPQTFSQITLDLINRKHTISDIYNKFNLVRQYDFQINMDLIAGLPSESLEVFCHSVDCALGLLPENFTIHTLALKSSSVLKEESKVAENEKEIEKMLNYAQSRANEYGYKPYYMYRQKYMIGNFENVGYCLKGCQCKYNIDMMEETANIFACGANAISKRVFHNQNRIERAANVKDFTNYISRIDEMIERKKLLFID